MSFILMENNKNILEIRNLNISYRDNRNYSIFNKKYFSAIKDFSITIKENSSTGIAGESGSGKTTLVKAILNLLKHSADTISIDGKIIWNIDGYEFDIINSDKKNMLKFRRFVQPIFQDPTTALDSKSTIQNILEEPMKYLLHLKKDEREKNALKLISEIGLEKSQLNRYPNEFSVGQRQRINIARALASNPKVLIADEPVSSLDVSIQSQILNLILNLKREYNFTLIFISHDLDVLRALCDDIAVMHRGQLVEYSSSTDIFSNPKSEYTKRLLTF